MKQYVLYNPNAGSGREEEAGAAALALGLENAETELLDMTELGGYPTFFAGVAADDIVIICGGDGTLNRLVNEMEGCRLPEKLYYYACGTGNDFLRDIKDVPENKLLPLGKYISELPLVTVNGKTCRFLNNVGFGIDGYCCEEGDKLRAQNVESINYTSIAIKGLLGKFKPVNATVVVDGVERRYKKAWLAPTMNGRFYGGGMMAAPEQDRLNHEKTVSVVVFYGKGKLATLMAFPSIFKGEHVKHTDMVEILTGHEVKVTFDRPTPLQIDGETVSGVTEYRVVSR